ncbi:uncharacterized protein LOC129611237 [Condylostylus longicornis]|uniref:uncharacterized protein LOC129611237 n=1 Tax=Condylostylus longicornis TaxID=2530218 RepID=UPI00244E173B|nr:uncharacterized protein LOC129611237 [Condylostylus longicornis]
MKLNFFIIILFFNLSFGNFSKVYRLQDNEVCAKKRLKQTFDFFTNGPEIKLGRDRDSVAIISQIWNSSTMQSFNMMCTFNVKVHKDYTGIYAAITKLKFRSDISNSSRNCIDYVEFSKGNKNLSRRICDEVGINGHTERLIFDDREKEMKIKISVNDKYVVREPLELVIVLTSHGKCKNVKDEYQCDQRDVNSCISSFFVGDNIPNCMNNCSDEASCFMSEHVRKTFAEKVDYSNIAISAITSLIFTMFAVGAVLYTCWKYWFFCQTRSPSPSPENELPVIELPQSSFNSVIVSEEIQERPPSPKDLPPSYESLFPDR